MRRYSARHEVAMNRYLAQLAFAAMCALFVWAMVTR